MEKKTLYPKTKRVKLENEIVITEKLDGSNIGFFKVDGRILIAQRNNVFTEDEISENKQMLYKGLQGWLNENADNLREKLIEGSGFFGEWLGMGKLKYPELDKRVYMFAKANYQNGEIKNLYYDRELFAYPFVNQEIPEYIDVVPCIDITKNYPTIDELNKLYKEYSDFTERSVEGFIVIQNNNINKYVRMKNAQLQDHHE